MRLATRVVLLLLLILASTALTGWPGQSANDAPHLSNTPRVEQDPASMRRLLSVGSSDLIEVAMEANRLVQAPGAEPLILQIETRRIAFHVPAIAVRFLDLREGPSGPQRIGFGLWSRTLDPVRADELADLAEHCPRGSVMSCPGWEVRQAARVRDGEQALRIEVTSIIGTPERRQAVLRLQAGHDTTVMLNGPCEVSWDSSLGMLVGRPPEGPPPHRACGIARPTLAARDARIGGQRSQVTFLKLDAAGEPRFVVLCHRGAEDRTAPSSGNCELQGYFGEWPLFFWVANNRADEWEAIHDRVQDFLARHLAPGTRLREGER